MNNSFSVDMYRDALLSITRGSHAGKYINAKPIFILAVMSLIEKKEIVDNHILYSDSLKEEYRQLYEQYETIGVTPMFKPYVFLSADSFYHFRWKGEPQPLPHDARTKYIHDHISYAYFDNALWDLLQDKETRDYLRDSIINYYLK